jgi:hypothetical protein
MDLPVSQNNIQHSWFSERPSVDTDLWTTQNTYYPSPDFCGDYGLKVDAPNSPEAFFNLFFTSDFLNYVVTPSNKKLLHKFRDSQTLRPSIITKEKVYQYLALLLILGINNFSNYIYCWLKSKKIFF